MRNQKKQSKNNIEQIEKDPKQFEIDTKRTHKLKRIRIIQLICLLIILISSGLLLNELVLQPYQTKKAIQLAQDIYKSTLPIEPSPSSTPPVQTTEPTPTPTTDEQGRLLKFSDLLALNEDVKGWLTIPDTKIDYPVLQSSQDDPEYYLNHNINKESDKSGSIFMDIHTSVPDSQSIVLHGHNMTSTGLMFHDLLKYNDFAYYQEHPVFTFDSIYEEGTYKIISIFKTNGSSKKEPIFNYLKANFKTSDDFLDYVYELKLRSIYQIPVDVTDSDRLVLLSTCSYELDNYRTVIVGRKIRDGESEEVDTSSAKVNKKPLYPDSWYQLYGGSAPSKSSFSQALEAGEIDWYLKEDPTSQTN